MVGVSVGVRVGIRVRIGALFRTRVGVGVRIRLRQQSFHRSHLVCLRPQVKSSKDKSSQVKSSQVKSLTSGLPLPSRGVVYKSAADASSLARYVLTHVPILILLTPLLIYLLP